MNKCINQKCNEQSSLAENGCVMMFDIKSCNQVVETRPNPPKTKYESRLLKVTEENTKLIEALQRALETVERLKVLVETLQAENAEIEKRYE